MKQIQSNREKLNSLCNKHIIVLVAIFVSILGSLTTKAQTNTMLIAGAWETSGNWSQGHIPTNTEDVIIPSDVAATINSAATCASLTIGDLITSASLTISGSNSLTITTAGGGSGNLSFNLSNAADVYQLNVNAGSLIVGGQILSGGNNGGSINITTGSAQFTNSTTINWGEGIDLSISSTGSATFTGDLSLSTASAGTTDFQLTGNGTFTFNGAVTQSHSSYSISNTVTAGTINFNGGYSISAGSFTTMAGQNIYFGSTFSNSGSALVFNPTSNTIFNSTTTVTPTSSINLGNVTISSSSVGVTLNGDISVAGNWTNNGGTLTPGLNTVTFNGTSSKTIGGTSSSQTFYNLTASLTAGQTLSVTGSTTTLTVQNLNQTSGNFSAGVANTININGDLIISAGTYTPGTNTNITGNFTNAGTYTAAATKILSFVGASTTTITGSGTYTIYDIVLNKSSKSTTVDVQSSNFVSGINTGNAFNFTFTRGTWKYNNTGTLNNCHNSGSTTSLTIPFDVTIESNAGTMNLCSGGTMTANQSNVRLSGRLYINGGIVNVLPTRTNVDFQYWVNGGTPEINVANGTLNLTGGLNYNTTTNVDYVNFIMTGGTINTGSTATTRSTFALGNFAGGSTTMNAGTINIVQPTTGAGAVDLDFGGPNLSSYSVTGGTVNLGVATSTGTVAFYFRAYTNFNYPHIVLGGPAGTARTTRPYNNADFKFLSLTINANKTFDMRDVAASNDNHKLTLLSSNAGIAFSCAGTYTRRTGTIELAGAINQSINSTSAVFSVYNLIINNSGASSTIGGSITTLNTQGITLTSGTFNPGTATTITASGSILLSAGTFNAPTTLNAARDWTNNGATFNCGTGTVNFTGNTIAQFINGTASSQTFYNLVVNKAGAPTLSTSGSITSITAQNFTNTAGNFTAPATLNITGDYTLTNGTFTAGSTINVGGNWSHASTGSAVFTHSNGTVNFTGSGTQNITGTRASETFYHVNINKTAGSLLRATGSIATITFQNLTQTQGNFTPNTAATININGNYNLISGTFTAGTTTNVYGDWTHSSNVAAIFTPSTNTVNFRGTGTQQINGTATSETFYNVNVNKTASTILNTGGSITTITTNNLTSTLGDFTAPATLTTNGTYTLNGGSLTAGNIFTVAGNLTINSGTLNAGNTIYAGGNWSHATAAAAIFNPGTGLVVFNGAGTQNITGTKTSETFYNVEINKPSASLLTRAGSIATITTQNLTQTSGDFTPVVTLNINGNYTLVDGTFTPATTTNVGGNWIHQTGATAIFTPGTNTITFNGTSDQYIQGTRSSETFYNLTVNKSSGTLSTAGSITSVNIQNHTNTLGNFTAPSTYSVTGNVTITNGTFTAGSTINLSGNWSRSNAVSAIFTPGSGTINFIAGGTQTIGGTATSETFNDVVINKSGGSVSATGSVTTLTFNNLQQTLGNITSPAVFNINGNYTQDGGVFTAGATINFAGNWTRNAGSFTQGTNTVNITGTANSQTIGGLSTTTFYNLTANNTYSTSPQIILDNTLTVSNTLTLTNGIFDLAGNIFTLGTSTAVRGTLAGTPSSTSYISGGSFRRWFTTSTVPNGSSSGLFPVGDHTGIGYTPISISMPVTAPTTGGYIQSSFTDATTNSTVSFLDGASAIEVRTDARWTLSTAALVGGSYTLNASRTFCAFCVGSLTHLRLTLANSVTGTAGTNTGTLTYPSVERTGISLANLSNNFYIGSTTSYNTPLPIELGDFKAIAKNNKVDLSWYTFTEVNNDYFTIEKTIDGVNYTTVTTIKGAGNSAEVRNYSCEDPNPFYGTSIYRLSQTDLNGETKICKSAFVMLNKNGGTNFTVYPNPNNGTEIKIDYQSISDENIVVEISNMSGQTMYSKSFFVNQNTINSITLNPEIELASGKYIVTIKSSDKNYSEQIIVHQ